MILVVNYGKEDDYWKLLNTKLLNYALNLSVFNTRPNLFHFNPQTFDLNFGFFNDPLQYIFNI